MIDDSGTHRQSNPFVLAGFAAPLEKWLSYSPRWAAALNKHEIPYLKSRNIKTQSYLNRTLEFVEIIRAHIDFGIQYTLFYDDYIAVVKGKVEKKLDSPFAWCLFALVTGVAAFAASRPEYTEHTLAFVFDDTTERARIEKMWDDMAVTLDENIRHRLAEKPLFVPDQEFTPLQAADLLAWTVRNHLDKSMKLGKWAPEGKVYQEMLRVPFIREYIDRRQLEKMVTGTREAYELLQADKGPKNQARIDRVKRIMREKYGKQSDEH